MGLILGFIIGDVTIILDHFRKNDGYMFDMPSAGKDIADFSLHIEPDDLNILSKRLSFYNGMVGMELRDNLNVLEDKEECGLFEVDTKYIKYVAGLEVSNCSLIADDWVCELRKKYGDTEISVNPNMVKAISDLIRICKSAETNRWDLMHFWNL